MKKHVVFLAIVIFCAPAVCLGAFVTLDSTTQARLRIAGAHTIGGTLTQLPSWATIMGDAQLLVDELNSSGDAAIYRTYFNAVEAADPMNIQLGESIFISSQIYGSLNSGSMSGENKTIGFLGGFNNGAEDLWLDLVFDRKWSQSASGPLTLAGVGGTIDANNIDGPLFSLTHETLSSNTFALEDSFTYQWKLPAGGGDQIDFSAQAVGSAAAAVPEPSTLVMWLGLSGSCAVIHGYRRWRQKRSAAV